MARKQNLVSQILSETIVFGGVPLRRADVARIMREDGHSAKAIDLFAFLPRAVDYEPLSYDDFRAIEIQATA